MGPVFTHTSCSSMGLRNDFFSFMEGLINLSKSNISINLWSKMFYKNLKKNPFYFLDINVNLYCTVLNYLTII